jgi:SPP1 family phage portal protein
MIGLEKYLIPVKPEEVSFETIYPYFDSIMQKFMRNRAKFNRYYDMFKGKHNIESKERKHEDEKDVNNKIAEPHLWNMVNFKVGYTCGQPIEYDPKSEELNKEIGFLNKHFAYVDKRSVDVNTVQNIYAGGSSYNFVLPEKYTDLSYQAPFQLSVMTPAECGKVYSSYIGNKELFDFIVTDIEENDGTLYQLLSIYTTETYYLFKMTGLGDYELIESEERGYYRFLPLCEKVKDKDRIGLVEINETMQDALDKIISHSIDNIEEFANQLTVIRNAILGDSEEEKAKNWKSAKSNGLLELNDPSPDKQADIKMLNQPLNHSDINTLYETIKRELYDCSGVPQSSSNTSSGGDTQGARQLGNGWENAYITILKEINNMIKCDREVLEKILFIERSVANGVITNLTVGDVDIKYNINRSNNLQVKTQSFGTLVANNVPYELAFNICELTSDPHTAGAMTQANADKKKQEEVDKQDRQFVMQQQLASQTAQNNEQNTNGINE